MSVAPSRLSVIIPTRNEAAHIGACLDAILAQDYPHELLEVIVVDGESDDGTAAVVGQYAARDARVRLVNNPRRIVPPAMNAGIRAARGELIARIDGHTHIAPDYMRVGVETLTRTGADDVGGPMRALGGGWFGDAVATATSSRFGVGSYFHFGTEEREVDTVYLGMWPRRVFERVGLFDEELVRNQDDELSYRIRKAGGRIVMNPAMQSWYQNRRRVRDLARQYYQYGEWKVRVLQKHPLQMSWRHFVPPALVAALLGLALLGVVVGGAGWLALALASAYGAGVLVVAAIESLRRGVSAWLATALAFAVVHLAWGTGFLVGLVRFADRWRQPEAAPPQLDPHGERAAAGTRAGVPEVLGRSI